MDTRLSEVVMRARLTAVALVLPLVLLVAMLLAPTLNPTFDLETVHFYVVTAVALLALALAILLSVAATRIGQYKVVLLAAGFMAMAGFFAVHGLATPGVLLPETFGVYSPTGSVIGASAVLSLTVPSLLFATAYSTVPEYLEGRFPFWPGAALIAAVIALVAVYGTLAFVYSGMVAELTLGAGIYPHLLVGASVALLLFSAWRQAHAYMVVRSSTQISLAIAFVLLAEAQVVMVSAEPWHLAWWGYHVLMLAGVTLALRAIAHEYSEGRSLREVMERVLNLQVSASGELHAGATIQALANAIELKDRDTQGHTLRVADYAVAIGRQLGLSHPQLRVIARAGVLHDIGKLGIPDSIICKPGPLDEEEWRVMKRHPEMGLDIVSGIGHLQEESEIILAHHERMDGSGYPRGLVGQAIPQAARIIAVADTYDVLLSNRPYRPARGAAEALAIVQQEALTHLDPAAVGALVEVLTQRGRQRPAGGQLRVVA